MYASFQFAFVRKKVYAKSSKYFDVEFWITELLKYLKNGFSCGKHVGRKWKSIALREAGLVETEHLNIFE